MKIYALTVNDSDGDSTVPAAFFATRELAQQALLKDQSKKESREALALEFIGAGCRLVDVSRYRAAVKELDYRGYGDNIVELEVSESQEEK